MTRLPRMLAALLAALLLAGCGERQAKTEAPAPREVSDAAIGRYCGMSLAEHSGPKGQVFVRGMSDPFWFSSVRDAFAFTLLPEEPKDIAAIYVNDMGRAKNWEQPEPGTWVEARKAFYVIGSGRQGGMGGDEAVPFGEDAAARSFAAQHGGRVVAFAERPRSYILPEGDPAGDAPPAAGSGHGHR
jgi:copper chaperone NosL